MERKLHPNVSLAEGVMLSEREWMLFGEMLIGGIPNHQVRVKGFPCGPDGAVNISVRICPLDRPDILQLLES